MTDGEGAAEKLDILQQLFEVLDALNRVSHGLRSSCHSPDSDSSAIRALAELRAASNSMFSANRHMVSLSQHFSELIELVQELHKSKPTGHGLKSFLIRRMKSHEISRLSATIESELQNWIDRETVLTLTETVAEMRFSRKPSSNLSPSDEDQLFVKMTALQNRLSREFDMNLQDLLLKSGIFSELEWVLCNPRFSKRIREQAAITIKELVLYNKNVFVGLILVGGSVKALVSMSFLCSLQVLSSLIKAIKSPLVDEIESCGGILKIIGFLSSDDLEMRIMAMNCAMEIGYYGRKEAVEALINGGLIKKLVELQRSELGGDSIEMKNLESHPFASCVGRFAVQLEVGEGLRQREKRAFKQQILKKVREACVSDAEFATIVAEVLWGSSPW
ncbi:hypothetical protein CDL12_07016 [Handroanthus impetiginosus]|uniref:Uncharacterized protein n=1 Tax=Handroanthus impetiginosus TaxID=429701 RepID=A0A2G9HSM9_9LAMI|nr:hypothetical protein CDL12_07016 [Handroanthus impetiginosus]